MKCFSFGIMRNKNFIFVLVSVVDMTYFKVKMFQLSFFLKFVTWLSTSNKFEIPEMFLKSI